MNYDERTSSEGHSDRRRYGYRSDDRHGERRGYGSRDGRGYGGDRRRDRRPEGDGERRRSYGERSGEHRDRGYGERRDDRGYRPRDRDDRERRPRDDRRGNRDSGYRGERRPRRDEAPRERPRLSIPDDVDLILRKGWDCELNGRADLAQILYLHGASRLSGGCENSLLRMLQEAGRDQFSTIRGRMRKECPEEIMPVFDYLCCTLDSEYDASGIRIAAEAGNPFAIHCMVRMEAIAKEDPLVDLYASSIGAYPKMVTKDLEILARKPGCPKAKTYLEEHALYLREKETIRTYFNRSLKGDDSALPELDRLSATFPEAGLLRSYVDAFKEGRQEEFVRRNIGGNEAVIFSYLQELRLPSGPYAKYLSAKKLQFKGEEWIPMMVEAVRIGSDDALEELDNIKDRKAVWKPLESFYMAKGDIEGVVRAYDGRNPATLEKYCNKEPEKILEVGRMMGGSKEIEWLSKQYRNGCRECRERLVEISQDFFRYGKPLIYALHDAGADRDAARVYFEMLGDPYLPSVKWLAKVCRDEEAKEYLRAKFEEIGDVDTFESIFEDDGYVPRSKLKDQKPRGKRRY